MNDEIPRPLSHIETYEVRAHCTNCDDTHIYTLPKGEKFDTRKMACVKCGCNTLLKRSTT